MGLRIQKNETYPNRGPWMRISYFVFGVSRIRITHHYYGICFVVADKKRSVMLQYFFVMFSFRVTFCLSYWVMGVNHICAWKFSKCHSMSWYKLPICDWRSMGSASYHIDMIKEISERVVTWLKMKRGREVLTFLLR